MTRHVLAEHLKEAINGRKVTAAVFHTFTFDPDFFENYLLPLFLPDVPFGDNAIQNTILWKKFQHDLPPVTVYCDFHAKAQKGIHLNYIVRPIDVPKHKDGKPCYHPKHSFILLEDWELIVITGSNNLTEAGWCSNLEGVNFFTFKNKVNFPREFKDAFKFFSREVRSKFFGEGFQDAETYSIAENVIDSFFRSTGYTEDVSTMYFDTRVKGGSYLQDFTSFIAYVKSKRNDDMPFEKVEVISPYFPKGISLFEELKTVTQCDDISISIPFENTDFVGMEASLFQEAKALGIQWKAIKEMNTTKGFRTNHAKVYQFVGKDKVFTVVGSINFTNMAWKGVAKGGNYESAILYEKSKNSYEDLLQGYPHENLSFLGYREEEGASITRENAFALEFVIDWQAKTLEVINYDPECQKGDIMFDLLETISINKTKIFGLSGGQITQLSDNPLIKVKPKGKECYFYYYPIHKNVEAKPLPAHLNLNDSELLQLWMELETSESKEATLAIIDRFIDRIVDEHGEVQTEELNKTQSTLNLMATHLSGILKLNNKIFTDGRTQREQEAILKMRDYYLFTDNVDTLTGYRKLIARMADDGKLNHGFYWLLLNCIDLFFYKKLHEAERVDLEKVKSIRIELRDTIKSTAEKIKDKKLTENHLKWTLKMLENDIKRN